MTEEKCQKDNDEKEKSIRNAEYSDMINRAFEQLRKGEGAEHELIEEK